MLLIQLLAFYIAVSCSSTTLLTIPALVSLIYRTNHTTTISTRETETTRTILISELPIKTISSTTAIMETLINDKGLQYVFKDTVNLAASSYLAFYLGRILIQVEVTRTSCIYQSVINTFLRYAKVQTDWFTDKITTLTGSQQSIQGY